ncbi:hypothetical protein [Kribbella sp. NPDC048928]|uniref:hypothetical protein n=1 Tax=Kribbella sp. NPDC048928 TaxID=3364111 RepID=UPI00371DFB4D
MKHKPVVVGDVIYKAVAHARGLEPGMHIDTRIESGSTSAALVKASARAAVVVIGSRGLGVMIGALVGSTGLDLAANARRHDLAVRVVAAQPTGTELHRITEDELREAVGARGGHDAEVIHITGHPAEHILRHRPHRCPQPHPHALRLGLLALMPPRPHHRRTRSSPRLAPPRCLRGRMSPPVGRVRR